MTVHKDAETFPAFRDVPNTGVIYVMSRAQSRGFAYGSSEWSNLGQGAPETGLLQAGESRLHSIVIDPSCSEYSPVAGAKIDDGLVFGRTQLERVVDGPHRDIEIDIAADDRDADL